MVVFFSSRFNGVAMVDLGAWDEPDYLAATMFVCPVAVVFHRESLFMRLSRILFWIKLLLFLSIFVAAKLWGRFWKGKKKKKIVLYCDNTNSCRALNTGITRNPFMQACLREICFCACI